MKKVYSVEEYIETNNHFSQALELLGSIILSTKLQEAIKWSAPVYNINNKNVIGLGAFKNHFGIWFFNGVFFKDSKNLLVNAQQEKTKTLRQMRFENIDDIDRSIVLSYVKEAIENQKLGKELKPIRSKKEAKIPNKLQTVFDSKPKLYTAFVNLTNYKQRESAKRTTTKQSRLTKIEHMILQGIGLHDKYKNC